MPAGLLDQVTLKSLNRGYLNLLVQGLRHVMLVPNDALVSEALPYLESVTLPVTIACVSHFFYFQVFQTLFEGTYFCLHSV